MGNCQLKDGILISSKHSKGSFNGVKEHWANAPHPEGRVFQDCFGSVNAKENIPKDKQVMREPKYVEHWASNVLDGRRVHQDHNDGNNVTSRSGQGGERKEFRAWRSCVTQRSQDSNRLVR